MSQATLRSDPALENIQPARRGPRSRILIWVVGIIVIGGMGVATLLPSLCRAREPANRIKCGSNLRFIFQAIGVYAQNHGGQYPPSLAALVSADDITTDVIICPSSNDERATAADSAGLTAELTAAEAKSPGHKHCMSYVYTGQGLTQQTATATTIVAYEPLENHSDAGTNVLFGDGHVEFISEESWPQIARDAGISIARRPGG